MIKLTPVYDTSSRIDLIFFLLAISVHSLLFFWHPIVMVSKRGAGLSEPIVGIDFIEEVPIAPKIVPKAVIPPKKEEVSVFKKLKNFFEKPKPTEMLTKRKQTPELIQRAEEIKLKTDTAQLTAAQQRLLQDKGMLQEKLNLALSGQKREKIVAESGVQKINFNDSRLANAPLTNEAQLKDKNFAVGEKDLPFEVVSAKNAPGQGLLGAGEASAVIAVGKSTSRDLLTKPIEEKEILRDKGNLQGSIGVAELSGKKSDSIASGLRDANLPAIIAQASAKLDGEIAPDGPALVDKGAPAGGGIGEGRKGTIANPLLSRAKSENKENPDLILPKAAPKKSSTQRRELRPAFELKGPLSNRKIIHQEIPEYPSWAEEEGIEASVVLQFFVLADGKVKEGIVIRQSSGYLNLDQVAILALKKWLFAPLPEDSYGEEWGVITFRFLLQ